MIERYLRLNNIENDVTSVSRKIINGKCNVHSHEFYEMEYVLSGKGKYVIDGIEHPLEPGMLFFMTPVNFHYVDADNAEIYNVMFSESSCNLYLLERISYTSGAVALKVKDSERNYYESILEELVKNKDDSEMCFLLINSIIAKLGKTMLTRRDFTMTSSQKAILYIIRNFRKRITLADIANHIGFAPSYLSELFKRETGIGVKQYVDFIRFEYAKNLVLYTDLSITQICSDSGFEDYANFIKRFKARYGHSPTKLRRND